MEAIGWASTALLLMTLARQVYTQWKSAATSGVSKWLFIGQMASSIGFTIYSVLLRNWVFVGSNAAILLVAIIGQSIYARNRRAPDRAPGAEKAGGVPCRQEPTLPEDARECAVSGDSRTVRTEK